MMSNQSHRAVPARIAVLDDDSVFLELMQELLGVGEGYEVFTCAQWVNSFEFIKQVQPDLVMLDLMLGRELHGWAVLELLRSAAETSDVPVILCTAAAPEIARPSNRTGVVYMAKPFDIDDLLHTIKRLLTSSQVPATASD
ncbi:MAG TPA: response regulator [Chloroflexota bacterium]|jgi:DNA-binding response OmpR family regulator